MVEVARGCDRLRPHAKTHKMAEIIWMERSLGIEKHKCATIAEAQMVSAAGGSDVLLAYPLVGPNIKRFARLVRAYPETTFRATVDDPDAATELSESLEGLDGPTSVLIDLDLGMGRTGIVPGIDAVRLYELVDRLPNLKPDGLHGYDGQIHDTDLSTRENNVQVGLEQTVSLRDQLIAKGLEVPRLVMGGTPTFPIYANLDLPGLECSPGTIVLQDHGYASRYPDMPFVPAALLLTRVVSRPRHDRLCLDLGHKAVAADPTGPRVYLPDLPDATIVGQNEEHLIVETPLARDVPLGTPLLGIPTHICPTCALHRRAYVVVDGVLVDEWEVTARDRVLGI